MTPERRVVRAAVWLPGLAVALGAAVATAHGLYEVALAARVPPGIAWLYPLITDGLALVAYAATARLSGSPARYAWTVVVLAAGLSGLAQAALLASATPTQPPQAPAMPQVPASLRFGVGAWPAVAAAIVAHLLYLLATHHRHTPTAAADVTVTAAVQSTPFTPADVQPDPVHPSPVHPAAVHPAGVQPGGVQAISPVGVQPAGTRPVWVPPSDDRPIERSGSSPARDRARVAAARHTHRHRRLPTVSELATAAEVSRGTASAVLKQLRTQPAPLHLITTETDSDIPPDSAAPTAETSSQP